MDQEGFSYMSTSHLGALGSSAPPQTSLSPHLQCRCGRRGPLPALGLGPLLADSSREAGGCKCPQVGDSCSWLGTAPQDLEGHPEGLAAVGWHQHSTGIPSSSSSLLAPTPNWAHARCHGCSLQ